MLLQLEPSVKEIFPCELDFSKITVGLITLNELKENNNIFSFSEMVIADCCSFGTTIRNSIEIYDDYSFGILNIIDTSNILGERDKIGFFVKKNLFLLVDIVDSDNSTKNIFDYVVSRVKPHSITLEKFIYGIFERLIYRDGKYLENIEYKINSLEDSVEESNTGKALNNELLILKKKLLILHNYYEQLIDIGEELFENENDIFPQSDLRYFKIFTDKVSRLCGTVKMLRENLIQLREAYEAYISYDLNRIMKIFTVITAIFMPLTLIVGWYGMNFENMPELTWEYGYIAVSIISIAIVILSIAYFKRKKFL